MKTIEIVIPELHEMHNALIVSLGSEALSQLNPYVDNGYVYLNEQVFHVLELVCLGQSMTRRHYSYYSC